MCFGGAIIAIHGIQAGANGSSCPWTHNWGAWGRLLQRRNETGLRGKKRQFLVKRDEATARKKSGRREWGSERQNMSGKCSTTCLQFIINFLKPSQSYGSGAHASRAISFALADVAVFYYVYLHVFSVPAIHEVVWGNTCCQRAKKHILCLREIRGSPYIRHLYKWVGDADILKKNIKFICLFVCFTVFVFFRLAFNIT